MPIQKPFYGFNSEAVVSEGVITLLMILGTSPRHLNLMTDFMVVRVPFVHNMILGRPCMRITKAVLSIYHLIMKFATKVSIGKV